MRIIDHTNCKQSKQDISFCLNALLNKLFTKIKIFLINADNCIDIYQCLFSM